MRRNRKPKSKFPFFATGGNEIAKHCEKLDDTQKKAADTNSDGKITIDDSTMIQKYIAELIDHLG